LEDGPPIFRQDFTCPALLFASSVPRISFHIQGYHLLWPAFPDRFVKSCAITSRLLRFRSPLLSESRLMSFPRATEMFQFTRFASLTYVFSQRYLSVGFPIRKSPDQSLFASSPKLIAGYHVLRRLSLPRHPPHALSHLTL
jgi:hypothetical protein